jgi:hypothetical protein
MLLENVIVLRTTLTLKDRNSNKECLVDCDSVRNQITSSDQREYPDLRKRDLNEQSQWFGDGQFFSHTADGSLIRPWASRRTAHMNGNIQASQGGIKQ